MELIINLKQDTLYLENESRYNKNRYRLRESILGYTLMEVEYHEVSNDYTCLFYEENNDGEEFFIYDCQLTDHGSRLIVSIEDAVM